MFNTKDDLSFMKVPKNPLKWVCGAKCQVAVCRDDFYAHKFTACGIFIWQNIHILIIWGLNRSLHLYNIMEKYMFACLCALILGLLYSRQAKKVKKIRGAAVPCPCCKTPLKVKQLPATKHGWRTYRITQRIWCHDNCKRKWHRDSYQTSPDGPSNFHGWRAE